MGTATTDLLEPKRDQGGRRVRSAQERAGLLIQYRRSGLTQRVFAQREGIKFSTFTSWLRRGQPGSEQSLEESPSCRFAEVSLPKTNPTEVVEVLLPNGVIIRGTLAPQVAAVAKELAS